MSTTVATAMAKGSAREVSAALGASVKRDLGGQKPALGVVFASPSQPLGEVMKGLKESLGATTLIGASSAGEFIETGDATGGAVLFAVAGDFEAHATLATGLKDNAETAVSRAVAALPSQREGYPHRTVLLLLDPLAGKGEEATLIASGLLGDTVRLAGGAAADDLKMKSTFVGAGSEAAEDAVVLAVLFSKRPLGVGVCHGHRALSGPMKVTRAEGNIVYEVDGKPAWQVWADATRERAKTRGDDPESLPADRVGAYLLTYEAGLATGDDYKIRAPLARNPDGSLAFACGIPQGSVIRITDSEPARQVESARIAARRARAQCGGAAAAGALVFDCICRKLILGDQFADAVRGISDELGGARLAGFETYGEIALDAGDMSGFHNTTTVVLAFPG